jgi:hypothetical protein
MCCTASTPWWRTGCRTNKAMGLRNLPSKTWVVNCGWVLAANIAADLSAWCRLLGLYDQDDLEDAEPDTLRPVNRTSGADCLVLETGGLRRL